MEEQISEILKIARNLKNILDPPNKNLIMVFDNDFRSTLGFHNIMFRVRFIMDNPSWVLITDNGTYFRYIEYVKNDHEKRRSRGSEVRTEYERLEDMNLYTHGGYVWISKNAIPMEGLKFKHSDQAPREGGNLVDMLNPVDSYNVFMLGHGHIDGYDIVGLPNHEFVNILSGIKVKILTIASCFNGPYKISSLLPKTPYPIISANSADVIHFISSVDQKYERYSSEESLFMTTWEIFPLSERIGEHGIEDELSSLPKSQQEAYMALKYVRTYREANSDEWEYKDQLPDNNVLLLYPDVGLAFPGIRLPPNIFVVSIYPGPAHYKIEDVPIRTNDELMRSFLVIPEWSEYKVFTIQSRDITFFNIKMHWGMREGDTYYIIDEKYNKIRPTSMNWGEEFEREMRNIYSS